ncbi:MAG: hypothetical protein IJP70_11800 [Bacteroidales bacterium]|nr:hypothetical protein [Bacteroidales bacterium]
MKVNVEYTDEIRRYWITDNLPNWKAIEGDLGFEEVHNCQLMPTGDFSVKESTEAKGNTIYVGHFINIWGHCITDNLKRLWFLRSNYGKELLSNGYRLVCTLHRDDSLIGNFKQLLAYLDIDANKILVVKKPMTFARMIIPQESLICRSPLL